MISSSDMIQAVLGIIFGCVSAAGVYALITIFGLIPRMAAYFHQGQHVRLLENSIVAGTVFGNLCYMVFTSLPIGAWILPIMGLCFGMYVGSLIMALAETLQVFPVLFRRAGVNRGAKWIVFSFALGKMLGSLIYYIYQWG